MVQHRCNGSETRPNTEPNFKALGERCIVFKIIPWKADPWTGFTVRFPEALKVSGPSLIYDPLPTTDPSSFPAMSLAQYHLDERQPIYRFKSKPRKEVKETEPYKGKPEQVSR